MAQGSIALVLHAHLPFVRHAERAESLEERWLFEALTETYLPLLDMLAALEHDRVGAPFTISLSPTLLAMLGDRLLRQRYVTHLDRLIGLSEREERRTRTEPAWHRCAEMYLQQLTRARASFLGDWRQDLAGALRGHQERGRIEIITTAATHAVLPLLAASPALMRTQIALGATEYRRYFGHPSPGFWLPECAYEPGLDVELARFGFRYFVLETHGLTHATPRPVYGAYAPIACPSGVAAFGRDPDSATQVWSAEVGYPRDPWYRDFHRDIGFDLPEDALQPFATGARRTATGLKYHRITGATDEKQPYDPARARARATEDAAHFVDSRRAQVAWLCRNMDRSPIVVCPYDAELFGHWWFEGPRWLEEVLRRIAATPDLSATTLSAELDRHPILQEAAPAASTWGANGHRDVWLGTTNDWIYPHLDAAAARLVRLSCTGPAVDDPASRRALAQALRELLLAQASDWAFMMSRDTAVEYATHRTVESLTQCQQLCDAVERGTVDVAELARLEDRHGLFPALDHRILC